MSVGIVGWKLSELTTTRPPHSWFNLHICVPCTVQSHILQTTVWVNPPLPARCFLTFFPNGWKFLVQILHAYYTFLSTLDIQIFTLVAWNLMKLCHIKHNHPVHIIRSKCPPSKHAGWSHLIWHNFVTVGDKCWIKVCSLAYMGAYNRHVKFQLKIPNHFGKKMSENLGGGGILWLTLYTTAVTACHVSC